MREKCGVFGFCSTRDSSLASEFTYMGLHALQHRGQESAGIAVTGREGLILKKGMGLVSEVFDRESLKNLPGNIALGHVRYSTTGDSRPENAQPLLARCRFGYLALAHNGNFVNTAALYQELEKSGGLFQSTVDSELVLHLVARSSRRCLADAFADAIRQVQGGYALAILSEDSLIGVRDPNGIRPLCLGQNDEGYFLASETCALDAVGARLIRDLGPGEMVILTGNGVESTQAVPPGGMRTCAFEFIYFARPDSNIDGQNVHLARKAMGEFLARESSLDADLVLPAPDSGTCAAIGFAAASGIPFDMGLARNRYVGRTFIQPTQRVRELGVRMKLNPIADLVRDKRIIMIDDSIVRGTTSRRTIEMLRAAGAREVHMCVASPPVRFPCYYGIDTSSKGDLIASSLSVAEIRREIGADTLRYLSLEGLVKSVAKLDGRLCLACLTGEYPTPLPDGGVGKGVLEEHWNRGA